MSRDYLGTYPKAATAVERRIRDKTAIVMCFNQTTISVYRTFTRDYLLYIY